MANPTPDFIMLGPSKTSSFAHIEQFGVGGIEIVAENLNFRIEKVGPDLDTSDNIDAVLVGTRFGHPVAQNIVICERERPDLHLGAQFDPSGGGYRSVRGYRVMCRSPAMDDWSVSPIRQIRETHFNSSIADE